MIEIKDLTVSNYVQNEYGLIIKIETIELNTLSGFDIATDALIMQTVEDSFGIPLGMKVLPKLGFDLKSGFHIYELRIKEEISFIFDRGDFLLCEDDGNIVLLELPQITEVHQLQNLYKLLTNKELTFSDNQIVL